MTVLTLTTQPLLALRMSDGGPSVSRRYPIWELQLSSQFPLQNSIGLSVRPKNRWAVFGQLGFSSPWYTHMLLQRLEKRRPAQAQSYRYLRTNLQTGSGVGLGGRWYPGRWRISVAIQSLTYAVDGTANELVNNLAPDEAERLNERVLDYQNRFPAVGDFYNSTRLRPTAKLTQVGFSLGRQIPVPRVNRLSVSIDLGILATVGVSSRVKSEGEGLVGRFLANQITPVVTQRLRKRFDGLFVPNLSFSIAYRLNRPNP